MIHGVGVMKKGAINPGIDVASRSFFQEIDNCAGRLVVGRWMNQVVDIVEMRGCLPVWGEDTSKVGAGTQALELTNRISSRDGGDGGGDGDQSESESLDHCEYL